MVKHKLSDNNIGREEISLGLKKGEWDTAKKVLKALGFSKGLWMERNKSIYRFHDIEWSLVRASDTLFYFEAEQESSEAGDVSGIHAHLINEAEALSLKVLNPEEMREFIFKLDREVNKEIEW
jgi:adenylate cyclase class IV